MSFFQPTTNGYLLRLKIVPGARRTQIAEVYGDQLKIRVAAPPQKGAANEALLAFLARKLQISKSQMRLRSGARDRSKVVEVLITSPELRDRLRNLTPATGADSSV
ncbi:MAG: DUF167 domain-containing protein [Deltaproteobacteria bacterium]|nr:DUF167 domain-containing protein [Deltaproteobacteria bacterium]